jgi:hypothetical protein
MTLEIIKDWLIPVSTFAGIVATAVGIWLSLRDWRLKVQAETRLKDSAEVEAQVTLLKLFTEIMTIAHARGGYYVSEKAIELLLSQGVAQRLPAGTNVRVKDFLEEGAILTIPVGAAAQDAAIAAIFVLGKRHEVLRDVAIQALRSLCSFKKEVAEPYLKMLESK